MPDTLKQMYARGDVHGLLARFRKDIEETVKEKTAKARKAIDEKKDEEEKKIEEAKQLEQINISETMKYANLNHVTLSQMDQRLYLNYVKNFSQVKPSEAGAKKGKTKFPSREYFRAKDPKNKLSNLSYSEKLAINVYTGGF